MNEFTKDELEKYAELYKKAEIAMVNKWLSDASYLKPITQEEFAKMYPPVEKDE